MHRSRLVIRWLVALVCAALVVVGLRAFAVQAFLVPSGSMLPTLQIGDRLLVDKLSSTIRRGDIIVFKRVPADTDTADADLVKRVIGLPGETISSRGSTVLINGQPLREPWAAPLTGNCAETTEHISTTKIAVGQYFVMGDCRGDSDDSRYWGTVPSSYVIGKVFVVLWRHNHPWLHWF